MNVGSPIFLCSGVNTTSRRRSQWLLLLDDGGGSVAAIIHLMGKVVRAVKKTHLSMNLDFYVARWKIGFTASKKIKVPLWSFFLPPVPLFIFKQVIFWPKTAIFTSNPTVCSWKWETIPELKASSSDVLTALVGTAHAGERLHQAPCPPSCLQGNVKESKILHRGPRSARENPEKREEKVELITGMKALVFLCRFVLGGGGVVGAQGRRDLSRATL